MSILTSKPLFTTGVLLSLIIGCFGQSTQEILPAPPPDHSLIYFLNSNNELAALPFEQGLTSLNSKKPAKATKVAFIELKGEHASTVFETDVPRFFLFTSQRVGAHPPFLVLLTVSHGSRRVTAVTQQGLTGFAISSDEIIKPALRVLASTGDEVFIEVRPRVSLMAGEYAIIGDDLARVATFRIVAPQQ